MPCIPYIWMLEMPFRGCLPFSLDLISTLDWKVCSNRPEAWALLIYHRNQPHLPQPFILIPMVRLTPCSVWSHAPTFIMTPWWPWGESAAAVPPLHQTCIGGWGLRRKKWRWIKTVCGRAMIMHFEASSSSMGIFSTRRSCRGVLD